MVGCLFVAELSLYGEPIFKLGRAQDEALKSSEYASGTPMKCYRKIPNSCSDFQLQKRLVPQVFLKHSRTLLGNPVPLRASELRGTHMSSELEFD